MSSLVSFHLFSLSVYPAAPGGRCGAGASLEAEAESHPGQVCNCARMQLENPGVKNPLRIGIQPATFSLWSDTVKSLLHFVGTASITTVMDFIFAFNRNTNEDEA